MKKSVLFTAILILLFAACALFACTPLGGAVVTDPDAILSGVKQISLDQYRTEYWLGEELNLQGAVLKVLLETGEIVPVDAANEKIVAVEGYNRFEAGRQIVTVKYGGKTSATFTVNVRIPEIRSVALKSYPEKLDYIEGEKLDMTGAAITVLMENGASVDFTADSSIVFGAVLGDEKEFTVVGSQMELSIRYGAMSATFKVNVAPKTLTGIAVGKLPLKQSYYIRQPASEFDPTGLTLLYTYNNGKTETVDASADSHLVYDVDFSVATNQSPVRVRYVLSGETLFEAGFTVIVDEARYDSIRIVRRPEGADSLIEGFSRIDYATGLVAVTFSDGSVREFSMDDPEITKDDYDNTVVGRQEIGVYYRNNDVNHATLTVNTEAKRAASVELIGKDEIERGTYYEGQTADISIAKLYYVVRYNNGTSGAELPVAEAMLTNGSDLAATAGDGAGGVKRIEFLIEGIVAAIEVYITPVAVSAVEITEKPDNLYVAKGGGPRRAGGAVKVTYNNRKSESVSMENAGIALVLDSSSASVGASVPVGVYYRNDGDLTAPHATYFVTVIEKAVASVSLVQPPSKTGGYGYGDSLALAGTVFDVTFEGEANATRFTVSRDFVDASGVPSVRFSDDSVVPVSMLLNGESSRLSKTADVFLWFYGVRADRSFRVTVAARDVRGISIVSAGDAALFRFTGQDYDSVEGLKINIAYTDNSVDYRVFEKDTARRVSAASNIMEPGFYFYTEGSITEPGELTVTVVYAIRNALGALAAYSDSYRVVYRDAALLRLTGIFTLSGGAYTEAASLGAQPKGLAPYLDAYYLGLYYENDETEYLPVTVSMTDYDRKNLTVGTRAVTVSFGGMTLRTTIEVTDANVTGVSVGNLPRLNYVFTESLSLAGGTLIRTFEADGGIRQDTVDMKEADLTLLTPWPASVEDFKGAASVTIAIELRYENVRAVSFTVTVYRPIDPTGNVTVANTQNYYGNVSDPAVTLGEPLPGFELPRFTVRYFRGAEDVSAGKTPVSDRYGNLFYPTPKLVGDYEVVVESEGNRYYAEFEKRVEFKVSPLPVTLTPNFVSKTYGTEDPEFTYTASNELLWREAAFDEAGNALGKGSFLRAAGENVGTYAISENPDDRFSHPYFVVTVERGGTLTINPALLGLDADPEIIFFKKDETGTPVDQKGLLGFRFRFISVAADGSRTVVTQTEVEEHEDDPAYDLYRRYLREISRQERGYYIYHTLVKGADGSFGASNPIDKKGKYELKVTISAPDGYPLNFLFFDEANPGVGSPETELSVSVDAEPFAPPVIGGNTLRLRTTETDLAALEALVAEAERENAASYDLVATDRFVYLWKYRPSQRGTYPEGEYLAYSTRLLGDAFVTYDAARGFGGYLVSKEHLQNDGGNAFLRLKFVGNGEDGDRGASNEIAFLMRNVF